MTLPIPKFDSNSKQERILVGSPLKTENGIRASDSRISWLGRSIKYEGTDGNNHYLNKTSALKFIQRNTDIKDKDIKKLSNHQIKKIIHDIATEVPADIKEKVTIVQSLADQNDPEALYNLGILYEEGKMGIPQDEKEAIKYYKLSADQGNPHAQTRLAVLYENQKDYRNALTYYKLASDQGDSNAQFNFGCLLINLGLHFEGQVISMNTDQAIHYFKLSADQGNPFAQLNLGVLYLNKHEKRTSRYGKEDFRYDKEAFKYLKLSADQGNKSASKVVGLLYSDGVGTKKNMDETVKYLKLSEDSDSWNLLGIFYEQGEGVEKNLKEAKKYYELAAVQNHQDAIENLRELKKKL